MKSVSMILAVAGLFLGGCSSSGVSPREVNEQYLSQIDSTLAYRLQPGDTVSVQFQGSPAFDVLDAVIQPDGVVTTGFGQFKVAGETPAGAAAVIKREQRVIENPTINLRLVLAAPRFVWVGGEVGRPASVPFSRGMTGLEAVMEVGGNAPTGKMWNILLVRYDTENTRKVHRVNLKDLENPLILLPRDIIYVPRTHIANVNTWVEQYIRGILPINPSVGPI